MRGNHSKRQAATGRKSAFDSHASGFTHGDQIIENSIHNLFIERGRVAKGGEVIFQGFGLHAFDGRHVFDHEFGIVGLAGHWAK